MENEKDNDLGTDAAAVNGAGSIDRDQLSHAAPKHTPSPWYIDPFEEGCDGIGVCAQGKGVVADVDSDYCELDEFKANAQLIAAAPELYEALKSILGCQAFTCDCGIPEEVFDSAEAAIAKAEGRRS
jgi:hypothetical protein